MPSIEELKKLIKTHEVGGGQRKPSHESATCEE